MRNWWKLGLIVVLTVLLLVSSFSGDGLAARPDQGDLLLATSTPFPSNPISQVPEIPVLPTRFPVVLDGKTLLTIQTATTTMSSEQRALIAAQAILQIANNDSIALDTVMLELKSDVALIVQRNQLEQQQFILEVTQQDAIVAHRPLDVLANQWLGAIRTGIEVYRGKYLLRRRILAVLGTAIVTILFIILIGVMNRLFSSLKRKARTWGETQFQFFRNISILPRNLQLEILEQFISLLQWILLLTCFLAYLLLITFFFPRTEAWGRNVFMAFLNQLGLLWQGFVNFLPNLLVVVVMILIARLFLWATRLIFRALETEQLTWPGFDPDWANPTQHLVTTLIWVVTLAIIFPYLPLSQSPAVQGLGLLLGALLTVGGAGTVSNLISGYVIIYSRAFQAGDLIAFDQYQGFVYEKTILATRIRSFNGEILTIPNSTLQSKTIVNYSTIRRDLKAPLIVYTTLTLGYDVPWRDIYRVLVEAALATPEILKEPEPFVLQTNLDDFYVCYTLKAFTNNPEHLPQIYSNLMENIQDCFNTAGLEIMSPHYTAIRDGNQTTIPSNYLSANYMKPTFQIELPHSSRTS